MLALILGAGFSKWAADLPVASQLFDFNLAPFGVREQRRLQRVRRLKEEWDTVNAGGPIEEFVRAVLSSRSEVNKTDLLWYIVRRLSEPYIWNEYHAGRNRRHVLMIDEYRALDRPGVSQARNFITQCSVRLGGIITPNYDLLVEYALGSSGFNYGAVGEVLRGRGPYPVSQWRKPVTLTGRLRVAKLHGSISWDAYGHYTDGRRGLTGNALIVAPTADKCPPGELISQWSLSEAILQGASHALVFGFAFNPYDEALLAHLKEAGARIRRVAIIDIRPNLEQAQTLWPKARISCYPPPPQGHGGIMNWLTDPDA